MNLVEDITPKNKGIDWEQRKKIWTYHAYVVIAFIFVSFFSFYSQNKIIRSIPLLVIGFALIYMGLISSKLKVTRFYSYNVTGNTREVKQGATTSIVIGTLLILFGCYVIISYLIL